MAVHCKKCGARLGQLAEMPGHFRRAHPDVKLDASLDLSFEDMRKALRAARERKALPDATRVEIVEHVLAEPKRVPVAKLKRVAEPKMPGDWHMVPFRQAAAMQTPPVVLASDRTVRPAWFPGSAKEWERMDAGTQERWLTDWKPAIANLEVSARKGQLNGSGLRWLLLTAGMILAWYYVVPRLYGTQSAGAGLLPGRTQNPWVSTYRPGEWATQQLP